MQPFHDLSVSLSNSSRFRTHCAVVADAHRLSTRSVCLIKATPICARASALSGNDRICRTAFGILIGRSVVVMSAVIGVCGQWEPFQTAGQSETGEPSFRMPSVHQGASHKYRLLFKLLFSQPLEFFDRLKTAAEGLASPPQSNAANGLHLASMLDLSSKHLGN